MNVNRLVAMLAEGTPSPGVGRVADALRALSPDEAAAVNAVLAGRVRAREGGK